MSSDGTGRPLAKPGPLLAAVSRSFFLSLRFLPEPIHGPLGLGYLLARTSDTLADTLSLPLEYRHEALEAFDTAIQRELPISLLRKFPSLRVHHPGEQELLSRSAELLVAVQTQPSDVRQELRRLMAIIIRGQRDDLAHFGTAPAEAPVALHNSADLVAYTYAVAGCVGEFWTQICALRLPNFARIPIETLREQGRLFGQGLQLVNILRDLPEDLRAGRCYLPEDELIACGTNPAQLLTTPAAARPVVEHWLQRAEQSLAQGAAYEKGIRGVRLRFSVSIPRRIGFATLQTLRRHPALETPTRVKVGRSTVLKCAGAALLGALTPALRP